MQKLITFPDPIYKRLLKRAKKIGFSFSEYMRMMSVEHLQQPEPFEEIEILDEETSKRVAESMEDFKNGRFVTLSSRKEIDDHFNNLK
jgi:predicted CopG family antitoxin